MYLFLAEFGCCVRITDGERRGDIFSEGSLRGGRVVLSGRGIWKEGF